MLTTAMKVISIAALILTALFWKHAPAIALPLRLTVGLSALLVARQAVHAGKSSWAAAFFGLAILFNPFVAMMTLSGDVTLFLILATVVPFSASLRHLKAQPRPGMPSITGNP